jgi:hypothetical protein
MVVVGSPALRGRTKWWIAAGVWAALVSAIWIGPEADVWIRAVEWTVLAVLTVIRLVTWRAGWAALAPGSIRRWMLDEPDEGGGPQ